MEGVDCALGRMMMQWSAEILRLPPDGSQYASPDEAPPQPDDAPVAQEQPPSAGIAASYSGLCGELGAFAGAAYPKVPYCLGQAGRWVGAGSARGQWRPPARRESRIAP